MQQIKQMLGGFNSPSAFLSMMEQRNPQFVQAYREFEQMNAGKSANQIAMEHDIDPNQLKGLF